MGGLGGLRRHPQLFTVAPEGGLYRGRVFFVGLDEGGENTADAGLKMLRMIEPPDDGLGAFLESFAVGDELLENEETRFFFGEGAVIRFNEYLAIREEYDRQAVPSGLCSLNQLAGIGAGFDVKPLIWNPIARQEVLYGVAARGPQGTGHPNPIVWKFHTVAPNFE